MSRATASHEKPPTLTGRETEAELRAMIVRSSQKLSAHHRRKSSLIRMLSGLSFASLTHLVNGFNRETCLEVLRDVCEHPAGNHRHH